MNTYFLVQDIKEIVNNKRLTSDEAICRIGKEVQQRIYSVDDLIEYGFVKESEIAEYSEEVFQPESWEDMVWDYLRTHGLVGGDASLIVKAMSDLLDSLLEEEMV